MARGLKYRISIEVRLHYPCSENKGADGEIEEENFFFINGTGHMIKMAVMPIHGQHLQKSSSEPEVFKS